LVDRGLHHRVVRVLATQRLREPRPHERVVAVDTCGLREGLDREIRLPGLLRDRAAQEELVRDRRNEASLYRPPVHDARHRRSGPSASEEQRQQRT